MSTSPVSPIDSEPSWQTLNSTHSWQQPEPTWQPPTRRVTFNDHIEYFSSGTGLVPAHTKDDDAIELGDVAKDKPTSAHSEWQRKKPPPPRIWCFSRRTFIIIVVFAVFLLGAVVGGVAATQISKKASKQGSESEPTTTTAGGAFPTVTYARPSWTGIVTPTPKPRTT